MCAGGQEKKIIILKNTGIHFHLRDYHVFQSKSYNYTPSSTQYYRSLHSSVFHGESYHIQQTLTVSKVDVCSFVLGFELEVVYECIYALLGKKKTHTP